MHNNNNDIENINGKWFYKDGTSVDKAWNGRCSGNGNHSYIDKNGEYRWIDTDELCSEEKPRPCGKCGNYPTSNGEDFCLHHLGNVMNACCGHGSSEGYIQFDNGITIRGYFRIENNNDETEVDNTIKTEIFICKNCGQIYNATDGRMMCKSCGVQLRECVGEYKEDGIEYVSTKKENRMKIYIVCTVEWDCLVNSLCTTSFLDMVDYVVKLNNQGKCINHIECWGNDDKIVWEYGYRAEDILNQSQFSKEELLKDIEKNKDIKC